MLHYLLTLFLVKTLSDQSFYDAYDSDVALKVEVADERLATDDETGVTYHRTKLYFDTRPGERLPTILTRPETGEGPFPCIVFLHGIGQNMKFIDRITGPFNEAGFAMITFDQLMQGERDLPDDTPYLMQAKAFRRRASATVIDARRVVDYLESRDDIDPSRIYLVGASYGAITGSVAAAKDERFKAAVLVYGGGDISKMLGAPMIREGAGPIEPLMDPVLIPLVAFYLGASDPVQYVGDIAPRPVLFQNGSRDRLVDPRAGKALQEACNEPKEISWYESDHIGLDLEVVKLVLEEARQWLLTQDGRGADKRDAA
ncbi:MAG: alpha/beta hydrolase [Candidatus Hydrogenedentota bacterium]